MKRLFTITGFFTFLFNAAYAQPAVNDTSNLVPIGLGDSIVVLTSAMSPGAAGPNQTWDFSSLTAPAAGYAQFVYANTTPYTATYPGATRAVKIDIPTGTIYEYDIVSSTKWEQLANNVTAATGDNYSANPKTMLPIPFHYNDNIVDTFYKNAVGPYTVTMTYDGYGTVITPYATYTNVIRMKRSFGGSDYYYDWYTTSPYVIDVVSYDNNTQKYTFIGHSTTGVNNVSGSKTTVQVYPNPFTESTRIAVNTTENMANATLALVDITGRVVREMPANTREITLDRAGLNAGLYFYNIYNNGACLAKGKLSIQ